VKQSAVEFTSDGESVDGILASPAGVPAAHHRLPSTGARRRPFPAVVVCHPHPLMGGNMESSVVVAVCRALAGLGIASLRFNFRGLPGPEPDPEELAAGAARDVAAAFSLMRRWRDARPNRCAVAGYSFGAAAVARAVESLDAARAFALIAPPLSALTDSALLTDTRPKLLTVGKDDRLVPAGELEALARRMAGPVSFERIEGADHFFGPHTERVARLVASFLASALL